MTVVNTVLKQVVHRAWSDIEPKLIAVATTGVSAAAVTEVADYLGVDIQPALAVLIATILTAIAGYLKSSVIKVKEPAAKKPAASPAPAVDSGTGSAQRQPFEAVLQGASGAVQNSDDDDLSTKYVFEQSEPESVLPDDAAQTSIPDLPAGAQSPVTLSRVVPADPRPLPPLLK